MEKELKKLEKTLQKYLNLLSTKERTNLYTQSSMRLKTIFDIEKELPINKNGKVSLLELMDAIKKDFEYNKYKRTTEAYNLDKLQSEYIKNKQTDKYKKHIHYSVVNKLVKACEKIDEKLSKNKCIVNFTNTELNTDPDVRNLVDFLVNS